MTDVIGQVLKINSGESKLYRDTDYRRGFKIHATKGGKTIRVRIRDPSDFIEGTFRLHDVGRAGHTKRVAGQLKSTGEWTTQAWIFQRDDLKSDPKVREIFNSLVVGRKLTD